MGELSIKDYIEILGIIVSTLISILAIALAIQANRIATQATKDNNRLIEESLRPELAFYPISYLNEDIYLVLVIKNIGATTCTLKNLEADFDFLNSDFLKHKDFGDPLTNIVNSTFGPNQSKMIHLNRLAIPQEEITFSFTYSTPYKTYEDTQSINFKSGTELPIINASTKDKELRQIYHTLLEMLWRTF